MIDKNDTEDILGYQVAIMDKKKSVDQILSWLEFEVPGRIFVCANPPIHWYRAADDPEFQQAIHDADLGTGSNLLFKCISAKLMSQK